MMKRRRLSDLYLRGRELSPDDGTGDPVKIWLAKLNEIDRETVMRRANAAKAKFLIDTDDEESEIFTAAYGEIREVVDRDDLVTLVIADDLAKIRLRIEAERAGDEETWGKDGYLQGLIDAWVGDEGSEGLAATAQEDPDDEEVARVKAELSRFETEVTDLVTAENARLMRDLDPMDMDTLRRQATHKLLELRASEVFIREFRRQQIFFAVRNNDKRQTRYFSTVTEVDDLDEELRGYLITQYDSLLVEPAEGKDSPPEEPSSDSSEPVAATPEPSGQGTAAA